MHQFTFRLLSACLIVTLAAAVQQLAGSEKRRLIADRHTGLSAKRCASRRERQIKKMPVRF
ncbi:hypothetical protein BL250_04665 [Erwinia sp. OLTSP20]|nr:hypothetical protein BV501_00640 [Erwinia sp. OAMSP11]PIJ75697.1 hypothetical protein BK416_00880 [Erwinia sp. OLSSP12]PIJ83658.1 hypothetical protein BLD46_09350 [Erwinia sp. OLMTSP26]PIJ84267.1 hypothetical protein BLD47_02685 [Erwinia sp. OLCASP19]PIJ88732.1 hypothetical protein BLD49_00995 [Erwinia sp. OLMDSP33]PIJ90328.1 hypothetical protein BL249_13285 [Erwinia sp. OLFS4]PIJ93978.1 hypothetical protein BL250_04665 [Erwinia sp. OLTSP20]